MGTDKIRHLVWIRGRAYWKPSVTVKALGLCLEALGTDPVQAQARAAELNAMADQIRRAGKTAQSNGPLPGSFSLLCQQFKASDEFGDLKPRTQRDYAYYLEKVEADFGKIMIRAMSAKVIKTYYRRVRREVSVTWGYHILATLRAALSWALSEDWIKENPALNVTLKAPQKRKITWTLDECAIYVAMARELGWRSIAVMALVFDSIGQSPVDVRCLRRGSYNGVGVVAPRAKTGTGGAAIPLFPPAVAALDEYLATQPPGLPTAPLFTNDKIGGEWNESTLQKKHRAIRKAAGLRKELQLQDFRTTAMTEGGAAQGTVDELKGLGQHASRAAGEHYVHPDDRFVRSIQDKRLAHRNKKGGNVETAPTQLLKSQS